MIKELSVFENSDINEIALKLEKGFNAINGILVVLNKENNIIGSISDADAIKLNAILDEIRKNL